MLHEIVSAEALDGYRLHVRFHDGMEGTVELAMVAPFQGVFAPLKDPTFFRTLRVNPELGTIQWDNGADVAPEVLYGLVAEKAVR